MTQNNVTFLLGVNRIVQVVEPKVGGSNDFLASVILDRDEIHTQLKKKQVCIEALRETIFLFSRPANLVLSWSRTLFMAHFFYSNFGRFTKFFHFKVEI